MSVFSFKHFQVEQVPNVHPVGTDAMILGALAEAKNPTTILDIGTGTGVLSLMMAQVYSHAQLTALDVNADAVKITNRNFGNSPFADRLKVKHQDLNTYAGNNLAQFELIISNPPYFEYSTPAKGEGRHNARHQSSLSLKDLVNGIDKLLTIDGCCWLILPVDQSEKLMYDGNLFPVKRIKIFGKPGKHVRDVICLQKDRATHCIEDTLIIRDRNGMYTEAYKSLTLEFHGVAL